MLTNSLVQQSLRRLASRNPSIFKPNSAGFLKVAAPAANKSGNYVSYRQVANSVILSRSYANPSRRPATSETKPVSSDAAYSILANQRRNRPVSPHLTIYRPQITWYLSALNRITGCVLAGGMYTFGCFYLISPLFGWQLGSAALAAGFAKWPVILQLLTKLFVAFPFTFHSFNGIRHLIWDTGLAFKNQEVIKTGWIVVALSAVSALGLALY